MPGGQAEPWRAVVRQPLADQVRRHASAADVVRADTVRFAEWASPGGEEYESARRHVEPRIVELHVEARRIGRRRGRLVALVWSVPVALVLVGIALFILITGWAGLR
jgi:hypothetical protein